MSSVSIEPKIYRGYGIGRLNSSANEGFGIALESKSRFHERYKAYCISDRDAGAPIDMMDINGQRRVEVEQTIETPP